MSRTATTDDAVYVCHTAFAANYLDGVPVVVREGGRHRGELPRRFPQFFTHDRADDREVGRAKAAFMGAAFGLDE